MDEVVQLSRALPVFPPTLISLFCSGWFHPKLCVSALSPGLLAVSWAFASCSFSCFLPLLAGAVKTLTLPRNLLSLPPLPRTPRTQAGLLWGGPQLALCCPHLAHNGICKWLSTNLALKFHSWAHLSFANFIFP